MTDKRGSEFQEPEKVVAISNEDVKNIRDFFNHFNIQMPDPLVKSLNAFESEQTWLNQELVKVELCVAMITIDHPLFKDELFSNVIDNSNKIVYEARFNRDLESSLGQK